MKTLKASYLLSLSLCSALFLTSCDKNAPDGESVSQENQESHIQYMPVTEILSETSSQGAVTVLKNMTELNNTQTECINNIDKYFAAPELEAYFKENYSEEELKTLNDFYSSELGKKVSKYTTAQMMQAFGGEAPDPADAPTQEELIKIVELTQNPTFTKFQQFALSQEGGMQDILQPIFIEELNNCGVKTE